MNHHSASSHGQPENLHALPRGRVKRRLRWITLFPLLLVTIAAIFGASMFLAPEQRDTIVSADEFRETVARIYAGTFEQNRVTLNAVMDSILQNNSLRFALRHHDRARIRALTTPIFNRVSRTQHVTHLAIFDTDNRPLLHLHIDGGHGPDGDELLLPKAPTGDISGVELNSFGLPIFTLCTPLFDDNEYFGTIELGIDIDSIMHTIETFSAFKVHILLDKGLLDRMQWEQGMHAKGRQPDWNLLPQMVTSAYNDTTLTPDLVNYLHRLDVGEAMEKAGVLPVIDNQFVMLLPLNSMTSKVIGYTLLTRDVSLSARHWQRHLKYIVEIMLAASALLFVIWYWLAGLIGARIERDEVELHKLATHDGLTGLFNHRTFLSLLEAEFARSKRFKRPLALVMLDIDFFKRVNDTYGHQAGDLVLAALGQELTRHARNIDLVCRYGGEEFAIVLPESTTEDAVAFSRRVHRAITAEEFDLGRSRRIPVTVSIGVATYPEDAETTSTLVKAADQALYHAKQTGRNRICLGGGATVSDQDTSGGESEDVDE